MTKHATFGRYRLIELLGRGGMGEVWRAHDSATNNRTVAIKLLPAHLATDADFVRRFRREAETAAQLSNPHIIPIHNYGEIDGRLYVDMRLIEGRDLHDELRDGPLRAERAVHVIEQVAKALEAAHRAGLIHRDVKPSNILLDDEHAYLIDFGIARGADQTRMTQTGTTIGSWHYMAPERFRAGEIDARSDVYALTCVLYECLTGTPPFPGDTMESQVAGHLSELPPRPSLARRELPVGVDDVIAMGMAKNPDDRYATARELASAARVAIANTLIHESFSAPTGLWPTSDADTRPPIRARWWRRPSRVGVVTAAIVTIATASFLGYRMLSDPSGTGGSQSDATSSYQKTAPRTAGAASAAEAGGSYHAEVVSFTQIGNELDVQIRNPNREVGLVRSSFELAMIDKSGAVIATAGQGGLAGAEVSTIYQLPPLGLYGVSGLDVPQGKTVASLELTITGRWLKWDTVNAPTVTLTNPAVQPDSGFSGPIVTGRVVLEGDRPQNVIVVAFVKTPAGTVVPQTFVDCAQPGQRRTFEARALGQTQGPYELESTVAYTTSVNGAGPQYTPNC